MRATRSIRFVRLWNLPGEQASLLLLPPATWAIQGPAQTDMPPSAPRGRSLRHNGGRDQHARTGNQTSQTIASYSSKGPTAFDHIVQADLVAPGNAIVHACPRRAIRSLLRTQHSPSIRATLPEPTVARNTEAPLYAAQRHEHGDTVVSGVAALLLQKTPSLTPDQVKARLMKTAWKSFLPIQLRRTFPRASSTASSKTPLQWEQELWTLLPLWPIPISLLRTWAPQSRQRLRITR